VLIFAVLSLASASAQLLSDGANNLPAFGSFSGSDFDTVSLQNGNLHISIPILGIPQRASKAIKYMFLYDTPDFSKTLTIPSQGSPFTVITPDNLYQQVGWFLSNTLNWGEYIEWQNAQWTCTDRVGKFTLTTLGVVTPQRSKIPFYLLQSTAPCFSPQLVAPALDGSGMLLNLNTNGPGLILKDGTRASLKDANGNLFSTTSDTLGRKPLTVTNGTTVSFTTPLGHQISGVRRIRRGPTRIPMGAPKPGRSTTKQSM
jgi:hypothetical protein